MSCHAIPFCFISSHLISSHLISSHLISSHLISSHLISSHLISSHLISSHLISSHAISAISFHLISCSIVSCHAMSSHLTSFHVSSFLGFYLNNTPSVEVPIGLETEVIPDISISASSHRRFTPPSAARLGSHASWCPEITANAFLQVDLGAAHFIHAVATQGHKHKPFYVTSYGVQLSLNGTHWTEYEQVEMY